MDVKSLVERYACEFIEESKVGGWYHSLRRNNASTNGNKYSDVFRKTCAKGMRFDRESNECVPISSTQKLSFKQRGRHAAITRRSSVPVGSSDFIKMLRQRKRTERKRFSVGIASEYNKGLVAGM